MGPAAYSIGVSGSSYDGVYSNSNFSLKYADIQNKEISIIFLFIFLDKLLQFNFFFNNFLYTEYRKHIYNIAHKEGIARGVYLFTILIGRQKLGSYIISVGA